MTRNEKDIEKERARTFLVSFFLNFVKTSLSDSQRASKIQLEIQKAIINDFSKSIDLLIPHLPFLRTQVNNQLQLFENRGPTQMQVKQFEPYLLQCRCGVGECTFIPPPTLLGFHCRTHCFNQSERRFIPNINFSLTKIYEAKQEIDSLTFASDQFTGLCQMLGLMTYMLVFLETTPNVIFTHARVPSKFTDQFTYTVAGQFLGERFADIGRFARPIVLATKYAQNSGFILPVSAAIGLLAAWYYKDSKLDLDALSVSSPDMPKSKWFDGNHPGDGGGAGAVV